MQERAEESVVSSLSSACWVTDKWKRDLVHKFLQEKAGIKPREDSGTDLKWLN